MDTAAAAGGYPELNHATSTTGGGINSGVATGARSSFQNNLQKIVPKCCRGRAISTSSVRPKIIADERTNSLLVFANDEDMKMIKTIISKLDVVLSQVLGSDACDCQWEKLI